MAVLFVICRTVGMPILVLTSAASAGNANRTEARLCGEKLMAYGL